MYYYLKFNYIFDIIKLQWTTNQIIYFLKKKRLDINLVQFNNVYYYVYNNKLKFLILIKKYFLDK